MKSIELHYAKGDLSNDLSDEIMCYGFHDNRELREWVDNIFALADEETIYLFTFTGEDCWLDDNDHTPIIICKGNGSEVKYWFDALEAGYYMGVTPNTFYLQEYDNWEDAYAVALDMRVDHPVTANIGLLPPSEN